MSDAKQWLQLPCLDPSTIGKRNGAGSGSNCEQRLEYVFAGQAFWHGEPKCLRPGIFSLEQLVKVGMLCEPVAAGAD